MSKIPPSVSADADTITSQDPPQPPEGFSIANDVVTEEAWEEICTYLGFSIPRRRDYNIIQIHGFEGDGDDVDDSNSMTTIPWESTPFPQNRPVAQFGFRYDYERDVVVADDETVPKIPNLFQRLLLRSYYDVDNYDNEHNEDEDDNKIKIKFETSFTQCIVNVYRPTTTATTTVESKSSNQTSSTTTTSSSIPWHIDDAQFGPEILVFTFGETRPLRMRLKRDGNGGNDDKDDDDDYYYSYFTAHPPHRSCYVLSGAARHRWEHSVPPGSGWRISITFRTLNNILELNDACISSRYK